jgi:hypothetical protein
VLPKKLKQKRNKLPGKRFGPPPLRGPNPQGISIDKKMEKVASVIGLRAQKEKIKNLLFRWK